MYILYSLKEDGSNDSFTVDVSLEEQSVDIGQQSIPETQSFPTRHYHVLAQTHRVLRLEYKYTKYRSNH